MTLADPEEDMTINIKKWKKETLPILPGTNEIKNNKKQHLRVKNIKKVDE